MAHHMCDKVHPEKSDRSCYFLFHISPPLLGRSYASGRPFVLQKGSGMNIVYAMTRNVYRKILPSLRSLAETNPGAKVYILAEDDALPFETPLPVTVINVTGQKYFPESGPNYHNLFGYINLLKVCYPAILKVQKVIHLDIDTVICGSLAGLWETDVKGKWYAAVQEYKGTYKPFGDTYYNMGVALINLAQLRKDKAMPEMVEYLNTVRQPWADQDAWNRHIDKAVPLDVRYNESVKTGETDEPVIVHYCSIGDWYENPRVWRAGYLAKYK